MITLFTWPRPMRGVFKIRQENAIHSWSEIPGVNIYLIDNEAHDLRGIDNTEIVDVIRTENGAPLLYSVINAMNRKAEEHGDEYKMFINTDIILPYLHRSTLDELSERFVYFMVVTTRWNVQIDTRIVFEPGWQEDLLAFVYQEGEKHKPCGSDIFLWRGDWLNEGVPIFALGRSTWDNWLMWRTLDLGLPLVDATEVIPTIHQEHKLRVKNRDTEHNKTMRTLGMKDVKHANWHYVDGVLVNNV